MKYIKGMMIACALIGMASAGWGEEVVATKGTAAKQGIRVAIRNAPGVEEFEEEFGSLTDTYAVDSQDGIQIDVMYARRHMGKDGNNTAGPMWGAGVFMANSSGKEPGGSGEVELTAFGAIAEGGIAVQLGKVVVLEAAPFLGLGVADQDITGFTSGSGGYVLYGVKTAIYFQIGGNMELGLEAGYSGFASSGELDYGGGIITDVTFTGDGFQGD